MKNLTLLLFATFCAVFSFGQSASDPGSTAQQPNTTSPLFLNADHAQLASAGQTSFVDYNAFRKESGGDDGKCGKFKKMKLAGIIAASVGGGLLITGIALEAIAVHNETGAYYNGYTYVGATEDVGLVGGGAACIAFGLIGVGGGVPLAVIGSVKSRKYCGGGRSYMELSTKGNGLALNF